MTATILEKSISFVTNKDGKNEALLIDLKNAEVAEYFEDLLDTLEAEKRMNAGSGRPLAEFKAEYLAKRK